MVLWGWSWLRDVGQCFDEEREGRASGLKCFQIVGCVSLEWKVRGESLRT